jgi:hypothetical protein
MNTKDLFKINRSARRMNESIEKIFGYKINLESFSLDQLQDARNKIRTQLSQQRATSNFNENVENEAYTKAQWMLDTINSEIVNREEFIIDSQEQNDEVIKQQHKDTEMKGLRESEIDQASAIVTANTMVDRLGRWIEELSGMENETLLQLGDSIRDEMGQEQSRQFIETVAPTIQSALETLKAARESVSGAVRSLATGESPDAMLGAPDDTGMDSEMDMTDPDAMNAGDLDIGPEEPVDDFDAAEPAAGGIETAGRAKRESIDFQNRLLKVLAG